MSRFCTVMTQFKDRTALIAALVETGNWSIEQIEIHNTPQNLFGYKGDQRTEVANIIIRRKFIGIASNDIGLVLGKDNCYEIIVSKYDQSKYGTKWISQLKGNYVYHKLKQDQEGRGRRVSRTRCPQTGKQRIEISGYR